MSKTRDIADINSSTNTAVGEDALENNTASNNTAVGYQAGYAATTEGSSVYVGYQAGVAANGLFNTFVGAESGHDVTSGVVNTFVGYDSGSAVTTGNKNVIIGNYNGNEGGLDIRTSSNNIVLSDGDGNPRQVIDSSGKVGIGETSPVTNLDVVTTSSGTKARIRSNTTSSPSAGLELCRGTTSTFGADAYTDFLIENINGGHLTFSDGTSGTTSERMRLTSDGSLIVGGTVYEGSTTSNASSGFMNTNGFISANVTNDYGMQINRTGTDGKLFNFRKNGSDAGSIGSRSGSGLFINSQSADLALSRGGNERLYMGNTTFYPVFDNSFDLGSSGNRFDDIYATNGTIQTSDFNEKQDIASLTATEMLVGERLSGLFKTFRWKDSVASNPNARTHTGTIAQDVQAAFTAEGLDAGDYSLFISTTWFVDAEGNEVEEGTEGAVSKTRMGIRYPELLCFVSAYNEQRFASIEARLDALEAV